MPLTAWKRLGDYLRKTQLLGSIQNTLYWDQNTSMPSSGAMWRGEQLSLLATILHSRSTHESYEALINEARSEFEKKCNAKSLDQKQILERSRNLELLEKELIRQKSLDPSLVSELAKAKAQGYNLWQEAREKLDFKIFSPALSNLISLRKEEARQIGESRGYWETLAQPFEPDITKVRVQELFRPLRERLPQLIEKIKYIDKITTLKWDLDEPSQRKLCDQLLMEWGRDPNTTSIARSPHPFSITIGPEDYRLTSRVVPGQPLSCFLATAHEWGHSLYEQGLPSQSHQWFGWPLGQATSMAVHESQSLFWENRIARSKSFSDRFWSEFSKVGAPLKSGSDLWLAMNPLSPGLNRVEADELTYGLHILIRTDLEISLLEEGLDVNDLPEEWNKKYRDLLGVEPTNDLEGCLQDVHWSEGLFGYFPSYLIGHLISAQLSEAMSTDLKRTGVKGDDPIETCISRGEEKQLLSWLRKEVHPHGRQMNAEELVKHVTGNYLSSNSFLNYLEEKLELLTSIS